MSMNTLTEEPEDMETMDETAGLLRSVSETDTEGLRDHKAEAWTEDVWGGIVLQKEAMQHSNEKLERRVNDFLAQATENDKAEFEQSRKDMLQKIGEVVNARSAKEQDPRTRFQHICRSIKDAGNKTSEVALGYMHMLDVMVGQAPEYVALAYGAIKIILIVQINYAETKQKVPFYLQQFAEKFRMIDHLTTLRPTKSLLEKISRAYAGYMRFLGKAVKLYKEGRFNPWKSRMQPIVDGIEQTFQDIKETAQYHGLVSTHINTDLSERILSIVTEMFDEVRTVRFNKKEDIDQAAANIRQRLDENLDNPTKEEFPDGVARVEPGAGDFYSQTVPNSLAQDLDELFPALRAAREESERRARAIEEHPDMREHRAAKRNLLRSEKFLSWLDSETSTLLWLDGNRLLSRLQLNSLFTSPLLLFGESNFGSIVVLRHSCAESASTEKYLTLVQSLVAQFLEQYPEIHQRKRGILVKERTTSMNSLWEVFVELLESVNAACFFIIIDSIDNVGSDDSLDSNERNTLLELLKQLLADKGKLVKMMVDSHW
ncbi:hypothetical protein SLS56_005569 [Neofusicoccum ribis]|uniref:Uncharacterized protein n=1 Tax=Neofusicoccum ribis TaxID=45134 RepID=A0ABR3ST61_9PEZI